MRTLVILDLKEAIVRTTGLLLRASRSDRFDDRKSLDRAMDWVATTVAVLIAFGKERTLNLSPGISTMKQEHDQTRVQ